MVKKKLIKNKKKYYYYNLKETDVANENLLALLLFIDGYGF